MPSRAFLGLTEVAGYFGALRAGLEELGVRCYQLDETADPFAYRAAAQRGRIGSALAGLATRSTAGRLLRRLAVFTYAIARCDIFVLNGYGFFRARELPLLRFLGKRVVWVFTGSDHRPPYLNARAVRAVGSGPVAPLVKATESIRQRVRKIEKSGVLVVAHSASAQLHARPFVAFLALGVPVVIPRDVVPATRGESGAPVRIVHSPSDPLSKGTDRIRAIVDMLREEGLAISYVEIIGRPHREVLEALAGADILVDEVFSDTPLGVLGTEAAWFGVPTICGGYHAANVHDELPAELIPPSLYVEPDALAGAVRRLVTDEAARLDLGARAAEFVWNRWTPSLVAGRYLQILAGKAPPDWSFDPRRLHYVGGWGIPDELRREVAAAVVDAGGVGALGLDGTPQLIEPMLAPR